jgi:hypothetical protein
MINKFAVWGIGFRTEALLKVIGIEHVSVFIDNNSDAIGEFFHGREVISFEKYIENYRNVPIIVTPVYVEDEIISQIESVGGINYLLLSMNPSEIQGYGIRNYISYSSQKLSPTLRNVIYGDNLFAYLMYETAVNIIGEKAVALCTEGLENEKMFLACMDMLGCKAIPRSDITPSDNVLLATRETTDIGVTNQIGIYDLSYEIPEYFNKKNLLLKDTHNGEACFIVATGPSLCIDDLGRIRKKGFFTFGVNRVFNIDPTRWKPDCYIFLDRKGSMQFAHEIKEYPVPLKCLNASTDGIFGDREDEYLFNYAAHDHYLQMPPFSENAEYVIYGAATVVYGVIQLAVYMGFETIYLLGTDCNYEKGSKNNYFVKTEQPDTLNHDVKRMFLCYEAAKEYADTHGIKIYNATRGGMLEVFERVDLDSLFE